MAYKEKIDNFKDKIAEAVTTFEDIIEEAHVQKLDAFVEYLVESGVEAELKSKFGNKSFSEIQQSSDAVIEKLDDAYNNFTIELLVSLILKTDIEITLNSPLDYDQPSTINLGVIKEFLEYKELREKAPEFYALHKAIECIIPASYGTDAINNPIFPYMLDCLAIKSPTRFDQEIKAYHLDILTGILQNQPEAFSYLDNACIDMEEDNNECQTIKEMVSLLEANNGNTHYLE